MFYIVIALKIAVATLGDRLFEQLPITQLASRGLEGAEVRGRDIFLEPEAMVRSGSALFDRKLIVTGRVVHQLHQLVHQPATNSGERQGTHFRGNVSVCRNI